MNQHSRRRQAIIGLASMVVGGACLAVTIPGQAAAQVGPPGNNGTIKVDNEPFDDDPNNEPHVDCVFQVDWYGYDEGDLTSDVTFAVQPPTGDEVILTDEDIFIGGDDNSGGGSTAGLDASETYDLASVLLPFEPHPVQGWHVKLTINAEGSQGADVKHKVFWVTGCEVPPTTSTSTTSTSTTSTTVSESTTTTAISGVTTTTVPSGELPVTGATTGPLLGLGAALLVSGATLVGYTRRFRAS